jgi:hypothetical protein
MVPVSRQHGRTGWLVLSAVLGIGALVLLIIYLSYSSPMGEAELQALKERKQNFERQAGELQQRQIDERQARQRRLEQAREVQKK